MLGYGPGAFVEIIDLTNAIFKNLTLSDLHKELLILLVAAHEGSNHEWEQHVSIAQPIEEDLDYWTTNPDEALERIYRSDTSSASGAELVPDDSAWSKPGIRPVPDAQGTLEPVLDNQANEK